MLGSIYSIIKGPTTLDNPVSPLSIKTFNILFFILGCIIIFGLELFKKYASKK
jgi:putative membrane protein